MVLSAKPKPRTSTKPKQEQKQFITQLAYPTQTKWEEYGITVARSCDGLSQCSSIRPSIPRHFWTNCGVWRWKRITASWTVIKIEVDVIWMKSYQTFKFHCYWCLDQSFHLDEIMNSPSALSLRLDPSVCTLVQNRKKHRKNNHLIIHVPTSEWKKWASEWMSERSGMREQSEQGGASKRVSSVSEQANGRASGSLDSWSFWPTVL